MDIRIPPLFPPTSSGSAHTCLDQARNPPLGTSFLFPEGPHHPRLSLLAHRAARNKTSNAKWEPPGDPSTPSPGGPDGMWPGGAGKLGGCIALGLTGEHTVHG